MAMHEALQGVTKVRLSRYCIFIEGSKLESTVFHYFNDNFILTQVLDLLLRCEQWLPWKPLQFHTTQLNPNIKIQIFICCPFTFSVEVVRRSC